MTNLTTTVATGILETFNSGAYLEAMLDVFYIPMAYWFFVFLYFGFLAAVFIRTKNSGTTLVVSLLISTIITPLLPPSTYFFIAVSISLCIFVILYQLFR